MLSLKEFAAEEFSPILQTEIIEQEISPQFTRRVQFKPLTMEDSQTYAVNSILQLEAIVNGKSYAKAKLTLAQLLWDQRFEANIPTYVPTALFGPRKPVSGWLRLNVIRGRGLHEEYDGHKIQFSIRASSATCDKVYDPKMRVAFSTVAEKGHWCRVFLSEPLPKPYWTQSAAEFPSIQFSRGNLQGFTSKNPIRVTLYGVRSGTLKVLGYFQFVLSEVLTRKCIPWYGKKLFKTGIWVDHEVVSITKSKISIALLRASELGQQIGRLRDATSSEDQEEHEQSSQDQPIYPESELSTSVSSLASFRSFILGGKSSSALKSTSSAVVMRELVRFPESVECGIDPEIEIMKNQTAAVTKEVAIHEKF